MKIIIDRFEEDYAVAELPDGTFVNIPGKVFQGASEGDVFHIVKDEGVGSRASIDKLIDKLFE